MILGLDHNTETRALNSLMGVLYKEPVDNKNVLLCNTLGRVSTDTENYLALKCSDNIKYNSDKEALLYKKEVTDWASWFNTEHDAEHSIETQKLEIHKQIKQMEDIDPGLKIDDRVLAYTQDLLSVLFKTNKTKRLSRWVVLVVLMEALRVHGQSMLVRDVCRLLDLQMRPQKAKSTDGRYQLKKREEIHDCSKIEFLIQQLELPCPSKRLNKEDAKCLHRFFLDYKKLKPVGNSTKRHYLSDISQFIQTKKQKLGVEFNRKQKKADRDYLQFHPDGEWMANKDFSPITLNNTDKHNGWCSKVLLPNADAKESFDGFQAVPLTTDSQGIVNQETGSRPVTKTDSVFLAIKGHCVVNKNTNTLCRVEELRSSYTHVFKTKHPYIRAKTGGGVTSDSLFSRNLLSGSITAASIEAEVVSSWSKTRITRVKTVVEKILCMLVGCTISCGFASYIGSIQDFTTTAEGVKKTWKEKVASTNVLKEIDDLLQDQDQNEKQTTQDLLDKFKNDIQNVCVVRMTDRMRNKRDHKVYSSRSRIVLYLACVWGKSIFTNILRLFTKDQESEKTHKGDTIQHFKDVQHFLEIMIKINDEKIYITKIRKGLFVDYPEMMFQVVELVIRLGCHPLAVFRAEFEARTNHDQSHGFFRCCHLFPSLGTAMSRFDKKAKQSPWSDASSQEAYIEKAKTCVLPVKSYPFS
jgi:hypothetical protein